MRPPRRGGTALEMALILPVALVLVFALMDWGWYLFHRMTVTRAVQQSLRTSACLELSAGPEDAARAEALRWLSVTGLNPDEADVLVELRPSPIGEVLRVEMSLPFEPLIGLVPMPPKVRDVATAAWYGDYRGDED